MQLYHLSILQTSFKITYLRWKGSLHYSSQPKICSPACPHSTAAPRPGHKHRRVPPSSREERDAVYPSGFAGKSSHEIKETASATTQPYSATTIRSTCLIPHPGPYLSPKITSKHAKSLGHHCFRASPAPGSPREVTNEAGKDLADNPRSSVHLNTFHRS